MTVGRLAAHERRCLYPILLEAHTPHDDPAGLLRTAPELLRLWVDVLMGEPASEGAPDRGGSENP